MDLGGNRSRILLFYAADTRSRAELESILGKSFAGVLSSDDFSVYNGYEVTNQQKCLAHLRRHFKRVMKLKPSSQAKLGEAFIMLLDESFKQHAAWKVSQDTEAYNQRASGFKERVAEAIKIWGKEAGHAAMLLLKSLRKKFINGGVFWTIQRSLLTTIRQNVLFAWL
jgi:transposase